MSKPSPEAPRYVAGLKIFALVRPDELSRLVWSFIFFFCLLGGYFMLRPVRDAVGVANGVANIPWLFTATLVVMLLLTPVYGWVVARYPRRLFLPLVYLFFVTNLLAFYVLLRLQWHPLYVTRVFFVWLSVFNLFVVSVFWSFMVDIYHSNQARRLFGLITAGGSLGAIIGPWVTASWVDVIGVENLLLVAALMLSIATLCIFILRSYSRELDPAQQVEDREVMGGSIFEGALRVLSSRYLLLVCAVMLLHNTASVFLYNMRAVVVSEAAQEVAQYTKIFGYIDLSVNVIALILQSMITVRLVRRYGMAATLMIVPALLLLGFGVMGAAPSLLLVIAVQVAQRSMNYGIIGPAKEMLFAPVDREIKYKSKNFIDTVVYRGSDFVSVWLYRLLSTELGWSLGLISWSLVPVLGLWAWVVWRLGHHYQNLHEASLESAPPGARQRMEAALSRV